MIVEEKKHKITGEFFGLLDVQFAMAQVMMEKLGIDRAKFATAFAALAATQEMHGGTPEFVRSRQLAGKVLAAALVIPPKRRAGRSSKKPFTVIDGGVSGNLVTGERTVY